MENIFDLALTFLKYSFLAGTIVFILKLFKSKKDSLIRTDVMSMQAKLSQHRLALRGKVKKKAKILRASFENPIIKGDMVDTALKQMVENNFEINDDFQEYFDLSKRIVALSQVGVIPKADAEASLENGYMCSDFKTEMDIARIIKEMYVMSKKINERIDDYNRTKGSKALQKVDNLNFASLHEIQKIFQDGSKNDSGSEEAA